MNRALAAFVAADYHPFDGIEDQITGALDSPLPAKLKLLHQLPAMLARSDYQETRNLGMTISRELNG